jgi:hypothetical protein
MERNNTLPHKEKGNLTVTHNSYFSSCPECRDDKLEAKTGCRFGDKTNCHESAHPDCWR